jgi:small ligand-binding sensory domain FIST
MRLLRCVAATLMQVLVPGCRMAGDVMTVTEAAGNVIFALNDRPVHDSVSISKDSPKTHASINTGCVASQKLLCSSAGMWHIVMAAVLHLLQAVQLFWKLHLVTAHV